MTSLRIYWREPAVRVLGPNLRAAVWVQGCSLGCAGCLAPYSWSPTDRGEDVPVETLADWVLQLPGIEGVTISGGEPFEQPEAVAAFIDAVRARADLGVVCYSGYTLEALRRSTPARRALLERVDLLVDGPYVRHKHANLRWRASSNQRLHALTPRYRAEVHAALRDDTTAGLEFHLSPDGRPSFVGVPPQPDFMRKFTGALEARGVALVPHGSAAPTRVLAPESVPPSPPIPATQPVEEQEPSR